VWRAGPDRVLLQRVGGPADEAATDLIGDVAYIWLALDEPATAHQLAERLAEAGVDIDDLEIDLDRMLDARLLVELSADRP
jgi:hypothetical protein